MVISPNPPYGKFYTHKEYEIARESYIEDVEDGKDGGGKWASGSTMGTRFGLKEHSWTKCLKYEAWVQQKCYMLKNTKLKWIQRGNSQDAQHEVLFFGH